MKAKKKVYWAVVWKGKTSVPGDFDADLESDISPAGTCLLYWYRSDAVMARNRIVPKNSMKTVPVHITPIKVKKGVS